MDILKKKVNKCAKEYKIIIFRQSMDLTYVYNNLKHSIETDEKK